MNILIADDDPMVLETLKRYVVYRGDTPFAVSNGDAALALLDEEPVDLVVSDIQMPGASGFDLLQAIRAKRPEMPVIIITGFADMNLAVQAVNQGAFAFLPKPILFTDLSDKIDEACAELEARRDVERELAALQKTTIDQQARLEQAKAMSVSIMSNIPFPVCVIDTGRRIHLANPAFREHMARTDAVIDGQLLEDAAPALNFQPFSPDEIFDVFCDPNNASGITLTVASPDSEDARYFHITGFPVAQMDFADTDQPMACLFMQDVTLRIRREEETAERQWLLRGISNFRELTNALVAASDFPDQVVMHLNALFGHFNTALIELTYKGQTYVGGESVRSDTPYLTRDMRIGDRWVGRIAIFSDRPKQLHVQKVLIDDLVEVLTRRIETHEFQMSIVQSERLRSLGEMAAGVAHELNQPLTGIRMFAEGLLYGMIQGWDLEEAQLKETLTDIVGQVDRASGIIDYMRDFSRRRAGDALVPFAVSEVVENALKLAGSQLKAHGIALTVDLPGDLPSCHGHPRQIEQVLLNLLANARHALDARIRLKANGELDDKAWKPQLSIAAEGIDHGLKLTVSDTGGGIPEDIVERIFEPFFTSKDVGEGTGLGLSISRNIVQMHGGDLWVVNRPGTGATFCLTLHYNPKETDLGEAKYRADA